MSDIFKTFRDNVRSLLRRPGWSQETLGKKTGYGQSYVSALLRGDKRFNEDTIKAFSEALGIDPTELFRIQGDATSAPLPPRLQRIVRYWQIEPYRNFVSWQEDEVFNGCIERGYISPDGEILRTGDEEKVAEPTYEYNKKE